MTQGHLQLPNEEQLIWQLQEKGRLEKGTAHTQTADLEGKEYPDILEAG